MFPFNLFVWLLLKSDSVHYFLVIRALKAINFSPIICVDKDWQFYQEKFKLHVMLKATCGYLL